jgi:hypothetical protein
VSEFIKNNGGVLVVLGVVVGIGMGYLEWRIEEQAEAAINAAGSVTPEQLESAIKDILANKESIGRLEKTDERFEGKIDRIVDILLEE